MIKESTGFLLAVVILGLLAWLPKNGWREDQRLFHSSVQGGGGGDGGGGWNIQSLKELGKGNPHGFSRDGDSTDLRRLCRLIEESGLKDRLERLADSLVAVKNELAGYRGLLLYTRENVRGPYRREGSRLSELYFSGVKAIDRAEYEARDILAEVDTLRRGLRLAERLHESVYSASRGDEKPRIRWLKPAKVPVREACTSCHQKTGPRRVMLKPGDYPLRYPEAMAEHPCDDYGCTVCHHGAAVELSAEKAHGPDHLGRPFWGGKLALRSCGLCHAGRSPVIFYAAGFVWPKSCSVCHEIDRLSAWEADSSLFASRWFPVDEMKLRDWLLRHWGEKVGRVPERDTFEEVVALMAAQSADTTEIKAARDHGPAIVAEDGKTVLLKCPSCGRTFGVAGHSEEYFCPADGSMLEQIIQTAQKD